MRSSLGTLDAKVSSVPGPKFCQYLSYSRSQKSNASETPPGFSVHEIHEVSRQDLVFWAPPLLMFKKPDGPGSISLDVSSLASRLPEDAMGIRRVELTNREAHTCTDQLWKLTLSPIFTNIHQDSPIFTKIHQYSPRFTNIHQYSPIFTNIHQDSPIFTNIHQYSPIFTNIHQDSPIFTKIHQYSPRFTNIHQDSPRFTNIHQDSPIFTKIHQYSPRFTNIHQDSPIFTKIHQYSPRFTNIHQDSPIFTNIHQDSPIFTNIHQSIMGETNSSDLRNSGIFGNLSDGDHSEQLACQIMPASNQQLPLRWRACPAWDWGSLAKWRSSQTLRTRKTSRPEVPLKCESGSCLLEPSLAAQSLNVALLQQNQLVSDNPTWSINRTGTVPW